MEGVIIKYTISLIILIILVFPSSASLVGNWTFDTGTGAVAIDTSGNNYNGTIYGAVWTTDAINNNALRFNGTGAYINMGDVLNFTSSAISISAWIKLNASQTSGIIIRAPNAVTNGYRLMVESGAIRGDIYADSQGTVGSNTLTLNRWYNVQMIYDGSILGLYIDNVLIESVPLTGNIKGSPIPLTVGQLEPSTGLWYNGTMDELLVYDTALNTSQRTAVYQKFQPVPAYPTGGITIDATYPPLTSSVNFSWHDTEYSADELIIAKDSNFNIIAVDTYTSNDYYSASLESGTTYYWKVRQYNSGTGTYGDTSATETFSITQTGGSGTNNSIQGIIYELINGVVTPISDATIYIYNSSWSSTQTVGTNGYYLFTGLSNDTLYYLKASKVEYQTSEIETVNVSGVVTRNILMKPTEPTDFESDKQYVKFRARWLWCFWDCDIAGATISAFKSGEVVAYTSGVTDITGSVSFRLYKTQLYRVTVVNSTANISQEMTIYPKDTEYLFLITNNESAWQEHTVQEKDAINISVSKTTTTITINYTDSLSGTSALTYYINQSNSSDPYNQTVIQSWSWTLGTYNHTFTMTSPAGNSYLVHVKAAHSEYGTIDRTFSVFFEKTAGVGITGISPELWLWFAIAFMFFIAGMFTSSSAETGLAIVCAEGWIFFFLGMFSSLNIVQFGISLTLATVIAVFLSIRKSQAKEGYT